MSTSRALSVLVLALVAAAGARAESTAGEAGVYTSAIFESEAAMRAAGHERQHGCVWKGRAKKEGKVICKGGLQLKCGRGGWFKTGPC